MTALARHRQLVSVEISGRSGLIKAGMRGFPDPPPALQAFQANRFDEPSSVVDASGTGGTAGLHLLQAGGSRLERVIEPSKAAGIAAEATFAETDTLVEPGLPWHLEAGTVGTLLLAPPFERGNARVTAELEAAARALAPDGTLYVALHKEGGAKRFMGLLAGLFEESRIVARHHGWRLLACAGPLASEIDAQVPWLEFQARDLELVSLPGVHAAGKLDPGTAVLSDHVPWADLKSSRVLDLGCGHGVLALLAARAGASVTACDDDLAAVLSCRRNSERLGLGVDVRHSDIDSDLSGERFDVVLCNPPFHVGRGVRLDLPLAFLEAARQLLVPGGQLWLVANRSLPYERELAAWPGGYRQMADERGFKVLTARC